MPKFKPQVPPAPAPLPPSAQTEKPQASQARPNPPSDEDIQWALELEQKVNTQAYEPTQEDIKRYQNIAKRLQIALEQDNPGNSQENGHSVKGLLDYPKDLLVGITNFAFKSAGYNQAEAAESAENMKDNFSEAWEGLKKGKLDDTIENTIDGFGDLFDVAVDGAQSMAASVAATVGLAASGVADGLDEAAEWVGDKLAGNDNEWSKTGASVVRILGGENSNENILDGYNQKVQEGQVESKFDN